MNVSQWLRQASLELAEHDSARLDADVLMCFVLECDRSALYTWPEKNLTTDQLFRLNELLNKRKLGYPIAYLIKKREFWSLEFGVSEDVLVPRPETELIVDLALQALKQNRNNPILDAGTGSGVIATAVLHQWQSTCNEPHELQPLLVASDYSPAALKLAKRNADKHVPGSIRFVRSNWLEAFADNTFGMIISNPPYIAKNDPHLKTLQYEPTDALVSGDDGLDDIRILIKDACRAGQSGCYLLLEHGANQAGAVCDLMRQSNYSNVQTHQDIAGLDRVSCGYCP